MTGTITTAGVYDLPAEAYHADPVVGGSLSSTGARRLLPPSCPALFRHWADVGQARSRVLDLGTAAHQVVLGVGADLDVIDADSYRTKAAQTQRDTAHAEGRVPLLAAEHDQIQAMAAALRQHELAAALLDPASGRPEQAMVWRDHETGVWRRALVDQLRHPNPAQRLLIPDYKTCASADPAAVSKAIEQYGYHQQGAWYIDGAIALGLPSAGEPLFLLVCQEKTAPYLVTVVALDDEALRIGRDRNRKALHLYRRCVHTGHWPGYADGPVTSGLPGWAVRAHDVALERGEFDITPDMEVTTP